LPTVVLTTRLKSSLEIMPACASVVVADNFEA
jgi:hypothetical protein